MEELSETEPRDKLERSVILSCRDIRKAWPSGDGALTAALDGIDLDVGHGETVAILGPSGCGKTTLLRILAGLDPPDAGRITQRGIPVCGPSPDRPLIFQQPALFPWLTVWENISFGLGLKGLPRAERRTAVQALLSAAGLPDVADRHPETLSMGMRQRVAVLRGIAIRPSILLLDEPFAALDVQTRRRMQEFLRKVIETSGASIVLVTHDLDEALAVCERVVLLSAQPGRVILEIAGDGGRRGISTGASTRSRRRLEAMLRAEADKAFHRAEARAAVREP